MTLRLPSFITFTGIDNTTSASEARKLASRYPIEWGMLFSPQRQGIDNRYPDVWMAHHFQNAGLRMAAHICGGHANEVIENFERPPIPFAAFERVQINYHKDWNGSPMPDHITIAAAQRLSQIVGKRFILQSRSPAFFPTQHDVDWLYDLSGGRGVTPDRWPMGDGRLVGYAGGINSSNVMDVIERVNGVSGRAPGPYWLDMESGVRDDGNRFSIERCAEICGVVYRDRIS